MGERPIYLAVLRLEVASIQVCVQQRAQGLQPPPTHAAGTELAVVCYGVQADPRLEPLQRRAIATNVLGNRQKVTLGDDHTQSGIGLECGMDACGSPALYQTLQQFLPPLIAI